MRALRALWIRLTGLFTGGRRSQQFDAELASHLEMHIEENIRRGLTPEEARRQALIALGGSQSVRDAYRDRTGLPSLESLWQDVRFAVRMLKKAPGFTAVAVLVLALGIGANSAMFTLINALLLRPLNGRATNGEFVGLYSGDRTRPDRYRFFSYPEYVDIRQDNDVFESLLAESVVNSGLDEGGLTRRVRAVAVSSNYFSTLGVELAAGRAFTLEEERPDSAAAVAVVSYPYWLRHGLTPDIVGRSITINGHALTIVGVAPPGFTGGMPVMSADLWIPFGAAALVGVTEEIGPPKRFVNDRAVQTLLLAGTLKRGVSTAAAESRSGSLGVVVRRRLPAVQRQPTVGCPRAIASGDGPRATQRCRGDRRRSRADDDCGARSARGVPQPRQHCPRARRRAPSGDRHPPRARRRSRKDRSSTAGRRADALGDGRRCRPSDGMVGDEPVVVIARDSDVRPDLHRRIAGWARADGGCAVGRRQHTAVCTRPGVEADAARSRDDVEGGGTNPCDTCGTRWDARRDGRCASCAVRRVAHLGGCVPSRQPDCGIERSRIPTGRRAVG